MKISAFYEDYPYSDVAMNMFTINANKGGKQTSSRFECVSFESIVHTDS